jgi:glutamate 5-kinase
MDNYNTARYRIDFWQGCQPFSLQEPNLGSAVLSPVDRVSLRKAVESGRPVVIKVGTSSLASGSGGIDPAWIRRTVEQVVTARSRGYKPVLVSSGAVAAGLPSLKLLHRPSDLPGLQATAAVGQGLLMQQYSALFSEHEIVVGQVLLTRNVFASRSQYLHARDAIMRMLELDVVPIVNENDTVTVDELRLGDNDQLAALVCHLIEAHLLVILTDTEGLFSADPRINETVELLNAVQHNDAILDRLYLESSKGEFGSGGATTKIAAARMAAWSGIPTVIAQASDPSVVERALAGEDVGTWISPRSSGLSARKLWIAFGLPARGEVEVDVGAVKAVQQHGRSLLSAGIVGVEGAFAQGDAVLVVGPDRATIGKGITRIDSQTMTSSIGKHSSEVGGEAIHRDDLVILS